jgi:hypothetical protein
LAQSPAAVSGNQLLIEYNVHAIIIPRVSSRPCSLPFPSQWRQEVDIVKHMGVIKSEITISLLRSAWQTGLRPFTLLADPLYPPTCAGCGVSVGSHRSLPDASELRGLGGYRQRPTL